MDKRTADAMARLVDIMDELRVKCPWDREQTFQSLRKNTIEELYELVDAIDEGSLSHIREELGDLLLHVVFYAKIGSEKIGSEPGAFDLADVAEGISDKLVFRHPHVFGEASAETPDEVKRNWEALKQREGSERRGVLSGVPKSLPALVKAYRIGEKAAASGFDWERREDVWDKVREEIGEFEAEIRVAGSGRAPGGLSAELAAKIAAADHERSTDEFGDLLFSLVNAARLYGIDPEAALERTNRKFISRFNHIEAAAEAQNRPLRDMTLAEMDALWNEAKAATATKQS
ncbi:MAG: nucleoside triphosphate pyrophosphohydrolase [Alistipes sp.]|jgi:XTP/dITP diphosphohydrolase|nr:nucleoside triphosphate pyrophosphohydrolase [Alistipes sp.]